MKHSKRTRHLILAMSWLAIFAVPAETLAQQGPSRPDVRARIQKRTLQLRINRLDADLSLSKDEITKLERILSTFDSKKHGYRKQSRELSRRVRSGSLSEKEAKEVLEDTTSLWRNDAALREERARAVASALGNKRGVVAVMLLERVERRIEARIHNTMRGRRQAEPDRKRRRRPRGQRPGPRREDGAETLTW